MPTYRHYLSLARNIIALSVALMMALGAPFVDAVEAATRYVNIGGSDTGVCTTSSPGCASITYAMLNSVSGDTIQVGPGIYNTTTGETFPIYPKDGVRITGAGNAGNGTSTVCGDANTSCLENSLPYSYLIYYNIPTTNAANTIFEGFIFQQNYAFGTSMALYAYGPGTYAPTIRNNTMSSGWGGLALWKYNYSTSSTLAPIITNNKITGVLYEALEIRLWDPFVNARPQITNNDFSGNGTGIYIFNAENNGFSPTIQGNTITGNSWDGVNLLVYPYAQVGGAISGNNISSNNNGINIDIRSNGTETLPMISNNTISNNTLNGIVLSGYYASYCGEGCWANPAGAGGTTSNPAQLLMNGTITGNTISNNYYGIYIFADDRVKISPTITGGTITNNVTGIVMNAWSLGQASPTIQNTTISGASAGIDMKGVVYIYYAYGVTWSASDPKALIAPIVTGNTITGGNVGINMYANSGVMVRPTIQNNTITNNSFVGIGAYAYYYGYIQPTIDHNLIDSTAGSGIDMVSTYWSTITPTIHHNTITNNVNGITAFVSATGYVRGSIKSNEITGNSANGVTVDTAITGAGVTSVISENTITGNGNNAVYLNIQTGTLPPTLGSGTPTSSGRNTLMGGAGVDLLSYFFNTGLMAEDNWWSSPPTWSGSGTLPTMTRVNTNPLSFTVSPASGGLGTPITITASAGTKFVQSTGHLDTPILVDFNGMPASNILVSADGSSLTAIAPDGSTGASSVTVTNPAGQSGTVASAFNYTFSFLPSIPVPLSPYNGTSGITSPVSFNWLMSIDPKGGPVTYDLYLCTDPSFASCPTPVNGAPIVASIEAPLSNGYAAAGGGLGFVMLSLVIGGAIGPRRRRAAIAVALCLGVASLGIVACNSSSPVSISSATGKTLVTMSFGGKVTSAAPDTVTAIRILITGDGMNEIEKTITLSGSTITETFEVPDGSQRHFEAFAMDAIGQTLYYGDEYVDLMGLPVSVSINMGPFNAVVYVYSGPLSAASTYYWMVVAKDTAGGTTKSGTFSFTTP